MRAEGDRLELALVGDPSLDDVLGEDAAPEQEPVVLLQHRQDFAQAAGR